MRWQKVCDLSLVSSGDLKYFYVEESEIMVINLNGQFYCLAARCTHAGAPLVEGQINGDILVCPWHYSNFRINDGSVIHGPAEKPLKTYQVVVKDNALFVEL